MSELRSCSTRSLIGSVKRCASAIHHALPEDIEDARAKLAAYLAKHREAEAGEG